jgi:DNA primase catalytic subunit
MLENYVSKRVKDLTAGQQTPTTTRSMDMSDFDFALAGDARSEKARLEEEAFVKEAEKRAVEAVRVAFIAQQILIKRQTQIKDLEEVNSDGSFNEKISTYKKEVSVKSDELMKSISSLNEIAGSNGIIVGKALALREAELSEALRTASKKDADVAVSAINHLKQKVKLPESY